MGRRIAFAATALWLAGCGPDIWVKPGATTQDLNVDKYLCENNLHASDYTGSGLAGSNNASDAFTQCMVTHGWSLKSGSAASPISAGATPADLAGTPDVTLCQLAVDRSISQWEARPAFADAVAEAKRRGLTVDRCKGMF